MKLLFCRHCNDVRKLSFQVRSCSCRRSRGKYLQDGLHAEVRGENALVIGLDNVVLAKALQNKEQQLNAWIIYPDSTSRVKFTNGSKPAGEVIKP